MVSVETLITGGVGILATVISSWTTWFFSKRKYNTEVDSNYIENLQKSLEFYKKIVEDNDAKLDSYIKQVQDYSAETYRLKQVVHRLLNNSCLNSTCLNRQGFSEDEIREILGDVNNKEDKNETEA